MLVANFGATALRTIGNYSFEYIAHSRSSRRCIKCFFSDTRFMLLHFVVIAMSFETYLNYETRIQINCLLFKQ